MQTVNIEGTKRTGLGRNASRTARKNQTIPCVLYGAGDNISFETTEKALHQLVYNPNFYKINVQIDGAAYETLLREVQLHPVTDKILHADFLKLDPEKKVTVEVPLVSKGISAGVKAGAKLVQKVRKIKVRAYPKDLVDKVEVDVTELEVGKSIRMGDISVANIEILGSKSIPVIACLVPRVMKVEEAKPAAAAATTAAPDASAEKKDDKKDKK